MSLQIWLPLNGDLKNNGIKHYDITTLGTVSWPTEGKIGKCFQGGNGTQVANGISLNSNLTDILSNDYSIAVWIKPLGTHVHYNGAIISSGNWNQKTWSFGVSQNNTKVDVLSNRYNIYINCPIPVNIWTHLVCIRKNNVIKLYKNGEYIDSLSGSVSSAALQSNANNTTIGRQTYANGYFSFNGCINDLRIYDHALSLKQIQQIAKGLVLHYKLDNDGMGGENLALNTHNLDIQSSKNNLNMYVRSGATRQLRLDGFYEAKGTRSWHGLSFWANQLNLTPGTKVTYSFYIYGNGSARSFSFYPMMFNSSGVRNTSIGFPISIDGGPYTSVNAKTFGSTTATSPEYHYVTFEWNQDVTDFISDGGSIELSIQVHGTWNTGDWACLFAPKVEYGDKPTPWSPARIEKGDSNIIYDSSGYQNNGTIIGNIQPVNNSPKYITAMHFLATTQKILIQNLITAGFSNSYTFSWWGKTNAFSNKMFWGFADGIRLNGIYFGNLWNTGDGSDNPIYKPGTTIQVTVPSLNTWHHFVMVGNGTSCLVYLDGELWGQAKTYKPISGTKIYFNGWDSGTSYTTNDMAMSDFRIYATALSAEDIKELYQTSALIDRNQNLYVGEVIE